MIESNSDYKVNTEGRFIGIDVHIKDRILSLCSIYAPTQDRPREQVAFLENVEDLLSKLNGSNIVVGGDYNCIMDAQRHKNTSREGHPQGEQGRSPLKALIPKKEVTLFGGPCIHQDWISSSYPTSSQIQQTALTLSWFLHQTTPL